MRRRAQLDLNAATVIVIGGGIAGCSVAYHLAKCGVEDVLLLERSALSSGTTWHSTGNMETYRDDPMIFEMVRYAASMYPSLADQMNCDIGWRNVGRVMYTDNEKRWEIMKCLPELGRIRNIELALLTPDEIAKRLPIINAEGLIGGLWVPSDARVNPTDAVMMCAKAAKRLGVRIQCEREVLEVRMENGNVRGVETSDGLISCDAVVVAAGMWSAQILAKSGIKLPLYALEHQYIITNFQAIDRNLPLFLSYDDQLYGREEVGGLMIGSLDDDAVPLSHSELPQNFAFALLSERWEQFEPYLQTAVRRFPLLQSATIKMLLNGPESFTPDGQMLLGPISRTSGLYVCCGFNSNGMALAPAAGRYVAEWIADGEASADVARLDVRRFREEQGAQEYLRHRVAEVPGFHCRIHEIGADYSTARNVLTSPLHEHATEIGAQFNAVGAWEVPIWFGPKPNADCGGALDAICCEVRAARDGILVVDESANTLICADVGKWTEDVMNGWADCWPAHTLTRPLIGGRGDVSALPQVLPWTPETWLISAGPEEGTRVEDWLRVIACGDDPPTRVLTGKKVVLEFFGLGRRVLVEDLLSNLFAMQGRQEFQPGAAELPRVFNEEFGESTVLIASAKWADQLWSLLRKRERMYGIRFGGSFAREALRIASGRPVFEREATAARRAKAIAPRRLRGGKQDEHGSSIPSDKVLVALSSPASKLGFGGREPIILRGETVGQVTSWVRLADWHETLALGVIESSIEHEDGLEFICSGKLWPLMRRRSAWDDA
jgi:4-methylaminobutanoate oxidase (formaldehyde-forming)